MLFLKVVLALPFFLCTAYLIEVVRFQHPIVVLIELGLTAMGVSLVLTRSFAVGATVFILGGTAMTYCMFVALMSGAFGGHQ